MSEPAGASAPRSATFDSLRAADSSAWKAMVEQLAGSVPQVPPLLMMARRWPADATRAHRCVDEPDDDAA